jgi:MoaA/NifB/PqqE/SkfB family radical SAM enzyme
MTNLLKLPIVTGRTKPPKTKAMITSASPTLQRENITPQPTTIVTGQGEKRWLKLKVIRQLFGVLYRKTGNLVATFQLIRQIREKYETTFGEPLLTKVAKVDGRYFWRLAAPGFPSVASVKMHEHEASRLLPGQVRTGLRSLLFAITKKCPMNCEHCFEWDNLNQQGDLPVADLIQLVHKYQDFGTTQMMFSGGEPMLRVNDLYEVLKVARPGTDFWIITSGLGLNQERARRLKAAGLTGAMVSLDHYEASQHDQFRGFAGAYDAAIQAVLHAQAAGLVTTLSLCATQAFTTPENLAAYLDLAKTLGVSFVQIVEPRATGRYAGKLVELDATVIALLEKTYLEYNTSKAYQDYPIINYLGYHQRKVGCFGSGDRFFYIDTDGDAHSCPFCAHKVGSALAFPAQDMIHLLGQHACFGFAQNSR